MIVESLLWSSEFSHILYWGISSLPQALSLSILSFHEKYRIYVILIILLTLFQESDNEDLEEEIEGESIEDDDEDENGEDAEESEIPTEED